MRFLCLVLFLVVSTGPAFALSCVRPDPARDFNQAQASDDVWVVVDGTVTFDETALPRADKANNAAPASTRIGARFEGKSLGPEGFIRRFSENVTLEVLCFGPWCGSAKSGLRYLAFLKRDDGSYTMAVDPCGSRVYAKPTAHLRRTMTQCFTGKACTEGKALR